MDAANASAAPRDLTDFIVSRRRLEVALRDGVGPWIHMEAQRGFANDNASGLLGDPTVDEFESDIPAVDAPLELMMLHNTIIIFLTLFGNILLISVVIRTNKIKRRRRITPVQVLMLHMCAADICFALLTLLPNLLTTATVPVFHGPNALCKFVKFIQVVPLYASAFLLVAISADRYYAICRPLDSMRKSAYNRPSLYAAIAWTASIIFSAPQLALFYKNEEDCVASYSHPWQYVAYVCVFNMAVWLVPSALAGSFYFCVCRAVWRSSAFRGTFRHTKKEGGSERDELYREAPDTSGSLQVHHKGLRMQTCELDRRRLQTVKLTLTIVAANFILWAPFCLIQVVDAIWPHAISPVFATYILLFGNLNSCMNPWIWFFFNRDLLRRSNPFYRQHSTKASHTELTLTERPLSKTTHSF